MNLDGLKRLLGMATKGAGQVGKAAAQAGQAAGKDMMPVPLQGAAKLLGKPMGQLKNLPTLREPRQLPGKLLEPMPAMRQQLQPRPMMARDGSPMPTTTFGPRVQEDDFPVWGPRGAQSLKSIQRDQPWMPMGGDLLRQRQQYDAQPQAPQYMGVDPMDFGYPEDIGQYR